MSVQHGNEEQPLAGLHAASVKGEYSSPSATLCILAYNQERYIEAAIAGAFAQDYPVLEIIVSDDRSTDGTWERICKVAQAYNGPHRVIVRQSEINRGVLHHLLDVAELASGQLLFVNAGDDISLPQRCQVAAAAWTDAPFAAAFSDYAMMDEAGRETCAHYQFDDSAFSPRDYFPSSSMPSIHGASSIYSIPMLQVVGRPPVGRIAAFDDTWLSLVLTTLGARIVRIPEVLVKYRQHGESFTNFDRIERLDPDTVRGADQQWQRRSGGFAATLAAFKGWHEARSDVANPLPNQLDKDIQCFERFGRWSGLSTFQRLKSLRFATRPWMVRVAVVRMLPVRLRLLLGR